MTENLHYGTVTEAINNFRDRGFDIDFNLEENCLVCGLGKFTEEEFEIVDVFRYEGNSDPGDEAAVYAIESKSGLKGILVTGYGISAEGMSAKMLAKLQMKED
jgi:hypothetical protein